MNRYGNISGGRASIHSSTGNMRTIGKPISSASFKKRKSITQALGELFKTENNFDETTTGTSSSQEDEIMNKESKIEIYKQKEEQRKVLRRGTLTPVSTESRILKEGTLKKLGKRYWADKNVQLTQEGIIYYFIESVR